VFFFFFKEKPKNSSKLGNDNKNFKPKIVAGAGDIGLLHKNTKCVDLLTQIAKRTEP